MSTSNGSRTAASVTRHHLVNLQVCGCVGSARSGGVGVGGLGGAVTRSGIQWRVLFCLCRPTSPQQSHPTTLLLLKSGLLHGNENCRPVPAVIMEFRGGRRRLNHNGIKEAWEGASRWRGRCGRRGEKRWAQATEVQARTRDSVQTRLLLRRQRK